MAKPHSIYVVLPSCYTQPMVNTLPKQTEFYNKKIFIIIIIVFVVAIVVSFLVGWSMGKNSVADCNNMSFPQMLANNCPQCSHGSSC